VWRRLNHALDEALAGQAAEHVRCAGVTEDELRSLLGPALYSSTFGLLYFLDEPDGTMWGAEPVTDVAEDDPRWILAEVSPAGELTGRDLGGLHESRGDVDPSGAEAEDWL
jgi:hypothetical protein